MKDRIKTTTSYVGKKVETQSECEMQISCDCTEVVFVIMVGVTH